MHNFLVEIGQVVDQCKYLIIMIVIAKVLQQHLVFRHIIAHRGKLIRRERSYETRRESNWHLFGNDDDNERIEASLPFS